MNFNFFLIFSILFLSISQFLNNGPTLTLAIIAPLDQQLSVGIRMKRDLIEGNDFLFGQFISRKKRQFLVGQKHKKPHD
ncbi:unnamed protein product [Meloidogyne enterolobii]|uniref:Uncharacterized protein n=2 Tax=Meloidogyne enterolobii TaxID=390850 RepID=A0A6V7X3F6_MELEN|nr:unnamed protein product [Meloidogyne enterolobii]